MKFGLRRKKRWLQGKKKIFVIDCTLWIISLIFLWIEKMIVLKLPIFSCMFCSCRWFSICCTFYRFFVSSKDCANFFIFGCPKFDGWLENNKNPFFIFNLLVIKIRTSLSNWICRFLLSVSKNQHSNNKIICVMYLCKNFFTQIYTIVTIKKNDDIELFLKLLL